MNPDAKPLIQALERGAERPPIWLMRQAGRYLPEYRRVRAEAGGFLDLCYTPELAAEVTLQPVRRFGVDAAILFSDILVIPDALGQKVAFREKQGPVLDPLGSADDVNALDAGDLVATLAPVYRTIALVRDALPAQTALIGFAGAPWTLATYMIEGGTSRDHAIARGWAMSAPASFDALTALLVDAVSQHLIAQIDAGAEVVQIFESWAGVIPAGLVERLSIAPIGAIAARVRSAHPDTPIIVFARGAGLHLARYAGLAGVDALGVDYTVDPVWARQAVQPRLAVQGNLDPVALLEGGAAMREQAISILDALAGGAFVFNLGHGVLPATPPDHVAELVELVHGYAPGSGAGTGHGGQ